jgi:acyl-CoA synthetase (AMP-forming)/AMP-acid ligase II
VPLTGAKRVILANPAWVGGKADRVVDPRLYTAKADEICRIILTSGSTGKPKAVAFTHRMLIERNAVLAYSYGNRWPQSSRLYCDMGLPSGPAFRYIFAMLMRGGLIMFVGADAFATEQSLELFKIQNMVTTPRGLSEHLKFYENTKVRCYLDHIVVAGGSLSKPLIDRAWPTMCTNLISYYGATEAGSIASADAREIVDTPNAVGYVLPHASVEIVDENDAPLGPNTEGIVRVRTPQIAAGYLGNPTESANVFRDGWFYSGDFGYLSPDRLLAVTGRAETRINIGGEKTNPEQIEEVLRSFAGVSDAAVLTMPNAAGLEDVFALVKADAGLDSNALRAHCEKRLNRHFVPRQFVAVEQIPRGDTGKIQRAALPDLIKGRLS